MFCLNLYVILPIYLPLPIHLFSSTVRVLLLFTIATSGAIRLFRNLVTVDSTAVLHGYDRIVVLDVGPLRRHRWRIIQEHARRRVSNRGSCRLTRPGVHRRCRYHDLLVECRLHIFLLCCLAFLFYRVGGYDERLHLLLALKVHRAVVVLPVATLLRCRLGLVCSLLYLGLLEVDAFAHLTVGEGKLALH